MVNWRLSPTSLPSAVPLVSAVSYLNTTPLVWGLAHSPDLRLEFDLPSRCADRVREGSADIGILPVVEIQRQELAFFPETGIACRGPVRSILLVSKVDPRRIQTLAADRGSRTSVMLTRILLAERYAAEPNVLTMPAELEPMLAQADAALLIGDAALHVDPVLLRERYVVLDLGEEWIQHTGLPMIFALWAGTQERMTARLREVFLEAAKAGVQHIDEIVVRECPPRNIPLLLGREYLTENIAFLLNERDHQGREAYLRLARQFDTLGVSTTV